MTLEACYASMEGDLDGVRKRMLSDERIVKFLGIFKEDSSMATLRDSIDQGDLQTAFRAAHTMKGIGRDLGLTKLYTVAEVLADVLRPDVPAFQPARSKTCPVLWRRWRAPMR